MFGVNWQTSKRQYGITEEREVRIRMSDGVDIDTDVFRPDAEGRFPALVAMAVHSKELQSEGRMPGPVSLATAADIPGGPTHPACGGRYDFFVRRGYAYIIGSARGTGKSGGLSQLNSRREVQDYHEVIEWAAAQPWCNGNVGTMGFSNFAQYATLAAATQPPHLKALWMNEGGTDHYRYFFYHGGILLTQFLLQSRKGGGKVQTHVSKGSVQAQACMTRRELGEEAFKEAVARALQDRDICAVPGLVEALKNPDEVGNALIVDYVLHPTCDSFHQEKNPVINNINVPVYSGASWGTYGIHLSGAYQMWAGLKEGLPKKMVIGPNIDEERPFHHYHYEALRWYDYWLKGIDNGIMDEPPIKIFVQGNNEWRTAEDWPLPETRWMPFNLHPDGLLSELEPRPGSGSDCFEDSPEKRGSLMYRTGPLVDNVEVIGHIVLKLYASCTAPEALFFISLWDINPLGEEKLLTRGWLRGSHRELDPELSEPWLPFHTHTNPQPLAPGEIYELDIEVMPTGYLFKPGHRIGLKISGVDDEVPTGFVEETLTGHLWSQTPKTVTVHHDPDYPSHLLLPITKGNIAETFVSETKQSKI